MLRFSFILLLCLLSPSLALAEKRVALVIGIDKYDNFGTNGQLKKARSDALAVARALRELGFDVIAKDDVTRSAFNNHWQDFLNKLSPGDTAAFYYAGHGGEPGLQELMKPGPLPELTLGEANAPVTIVEYASMTSSHCANFHTKVLPVLKEKYIDKGQVRLVFREFPLNPRSAIAATVARCATGERTLPLIEALFSEQDDWVWARSEAEFTGKLFALAQQAGLSKQTFDQCSQNKKLIQDIIAVRDRAHQSFGVNATPTFFVNGKKFEGATVDFEKAIAQLLPPPEPQTPP